MVIRKLDGGFFDSGKQGVALKSEAVSLYLTIVRLATHVFAEFTMN